MGESFGKLLREARRSKGLTLGDVARQIGVSVSYVSDIEHERRTALPTNVVLTLASAIGVNPQPLLEASIAQRKSLDFGDMMLESPRGTLKVELAAGLSRTIDTMSDTKLRKLIQLIDDEDEL